MLFDLTNLKNQALAHRGGLSGEAINAQGTKTPVTNRPNADYFTTPNPGLFL
jgi:hypothetical protein